MLKCLHISFISYSLWKCQLSIYSQYCCKTWFTKCNFKFFSRKVLSSMIYLKEIFLNTYFFSIPLEMYEYVTRTEKISNSTLFSWVHEDAQWTALFNNKHRATWHHRVLTPPQTVLGEAKEGIAFNWTSKDPIPPHWDMR